MNKDDLTNIPIIDLHDILLRPIRYEDYNDLFDYGSDERVTKTLAWGPFTDVEEAKTSVVQVFLSRPERGLPLAHAIVDQKTNKMIGTCDFHTIDFVTLRGEIGYCIHFDYWGKGIMTKVCGAVIDFGFQYLGLEHIDISHEVNNIGSQKVIEKCGFRFVEETVHPRYQTTNRFYTLHKDDVIIRKATYHDATQKGYVHYTSWMETYTGLIKQEYLDTLTLERSVDIAKQYYEHDLVAVIGGKVVGFASCNVSRDHLEDTGEVMAIYVLQDYAKKGIGKQLMLACYQQLKAYKRVAVWVLSSNENAIAFYEHIGFARDGVEKEVDVKTTVLHEVRLIKKMK